MVLDLPGTSETLTPLAMPLPYGTSRVLVAEGTRGIEQTIALMQKMVNSYKRNDDIRALVGKILNPKDGSRPCQSKDYFCYAKRLYEWVRDNMLYAYDPHLVEYIESPKRLLKNRIGDCDSMDMLLASMFEQVGLQAQFVTIKADASRPDEFTHVYVRVKIPKVGWVDADPIMPDKSFGWGAPYPEGRRYWPASADELDGPLDTSDSAMVSSSASPMSNAEIPGLTGLSGLGRGGGGGRWRRGGGGWGYGNYWGGGLGPWYADGLDQSQVVIVPLVVADKTVMPGESVELQPNDHPMYDQSVGMSGLARFGDEASDIAAVKEQIHKQIDQVGKALMAAQKLPDSDPTKASKIAALNKAKMALFQQMYSTNPSASTFSFIDSFVEEVKKGGVTEGLRSAFSTPNAESVKTVGKYALAGMGLFLVYKILTRGRSASAA